MSWVLLYAWTLAGGQALGGVATGSQLYLWGDRVWSGSLDSDRAPREVARPPDGSTFGPGGCAADVDGDGDTDLIVLERRAGSELGRIVWLEAPRWRRRVVDDGAAFGQCLPTDYFGSRGVLLIHRGIQVRFYRFPRARGGEWRYDEVYSIYTPSEQGGLARMDVDGDGRLDILAGNYWIQSPTAAGLPWRLFAINSWWEGEASADLRILPMGDGVLAAAESTADPARLAIFRRPPDPKQFWQETRVTADPPVRKPSALASFVTGFLVAENAGAQSRLLAVENGSATTVAVMPAGAFGLWTYQGRAIAAGADGVRVYLRK